MSNLEQLLKDKYPDSEISDIQRAAFLEGYTQGLESAIEVVSGLGNQQMSLLELSLLVASETVIEKIKPKVNG